MEKILTVTDVAAILQVTPMTVREMFREKRLRAFKVGKAWRTTEEMLQEDLAGLAGQAPSPAPAVAKAPSPKTESEPIPEAEPKPKKKARAPKKSVPAEDGGAKDDSQQMLF